MTGWDYTWDEFLQTGARIAAIRQAFNLREGVSVADIDMSPRATGHPPAASGPLKGVSIDVALQKQELYRARGWHPETGSPLKETLVQLALDDIAADLYGADAKQNRGADH